MEIIPVIDLLQGQVVHAKRGERHHYRPVVSSLCESSRIDNVVRGLLGLYPFKKLYIADLDAILGQGNHAGQIRQLCASHPQLEIWLDAGFSQPADIIAWQSENVRCIIGSERLQSFSQYQAIAEGARDFKLSLDFAADCFLGPEQLLEREDTWPRQTICMTLSRVGSKLGPDYGRLQALIQRKPESLWYAAGGVRGEDDLIDLKSMGVAGVLVASALHDGMITGEQIARLAA